MDEAGSQPFGDREGGNYAAATGSSEGVRVGFWELVYSRSPPITWGGDRPNPALPAGTGAAWRGRRSLSSAPCAAFNTAFFFFPFFF